MLKYKKGSINKIIDVISRPPIVKIRATRGINYIVKRTFSDPNFTEKGLPIVLYQYNFMNMILM